MFSTLVLTAAMIMTKQAGLPPLPAIPREFRGAWIATVANIDWPTVKGETEAVAKAQMNEIVEKAYRLHLNALIFQVRPSADALYESNLEPWSEYLTGKQGLAPKPLWDPLQFLIEKAHAHGIQVHAWFNPYRAESSAQKGPNTSSHVSHTHPDLVHKYGENLWMDPGSKWIQKHTLKVILDVVKRYNIDGVQIDDYFYPYPIYDAKKHKIDFPDSKLYEEYKSAGGKLDKNEWRRQNVDHLVHSIYDGIKKLKPWVLFGISPFGIYRPGIPTGIQAGVDQYDDLFSDPLLWLQKGWCDYLSPQLYWAISQTPQAYPTLLNWWISVNSLHRHIWPGLYTGRITTSASSWSPHEILNQIALNRKSAEPDQTQFDGLAALTPKERGASGEIHFSFNTFQVDPKGLDFDLVSGPYKEPSLPPTSPWLIKMKAPSIISASAETGDSDNFANVELKPSSSTEFVGYSELIDGNWTSWTFTNRFKFQVPDAKYIALISVDNFDQISRAKIISPKGRLRQLEESK